jgi:hypothetical protein
MPCTVPGLSFRNLCRRRFRVTAVVVRLRHAKCRTLIVDMGGTSTSHLAIGYIKAGFLMVADKRFWSRLVGSTCLLVHEQSLQCTFGEQITSIVLLREEIRPNDSFETSYSTSHWYVSVRREPWGHNSPRGRLAEM